MRGFSCFDFNVFSIYSPSRKAVYFLTFVLYEHHSRSIHALVNTVRDLYQESLGHEKEAFKRLFFSLLFIPRVVEMRALYQNFRNCKNFIPPSHSSRDSVAYRHRDRAFWQSRPRRDRVEWAGEMVRGVDGMLAPRWHYHRDPIDALLQL